MKSILTAIIFVLTLQLSIASEYHLNSFPLKNVKLNEGPFLQAQQTDLKYILELDADRLLAPFLKDADIEPDAPNYGNWESTGLDGHIGGHYLSALAMMYASTKDERLIERLNYSIDKLEQCQIKNGNGYVGGVVGAQKMWKEIANGKITVDNFSLNKTWVPWYNIHKLFAGLRDAYLFADNEKALGMLIKLTDWAYEFSSHLTDDQIQKMLRCEHGGMNEIFADVAELTGNKKYLELARRYSHHLILDPLVKGEDKLTGMHANTQIPKVIGYKRIADIENDTIWNNASKFFWETVVEHRTLSFGGNSVREHFNPTNDFSKVIESEQGPETCNTYNMLKLSRAFFESEQETKYLDFYERGLFNHILSSQMPEKGGFVYFTPIRPQHYRVYSQPHEGFWCCVGSGLENHSKYGEFIYSYDDDANLYVNLFIASTVTWEEKDMTIEQQTKFPFEEKTTFIVSPKKKTKFTLKLRYPNWVKAGALKLLINGNVQEVNAQPGQLISICRKWKKGDKVELWLPMHISVETLPDNSPWLTFMYGPIELAAKTSTNDLKGLYANDSRMGHVAQGPLFPIEESPMIIGNIDNIAGQVTPIEGKPLTFSIADIVFPNTYKGLELIPFFTLHEARYMLYWRHTTAEKAATLKQVMLEKDTKIRLLEEATIDQVATGEQQPESDHGFKGDGVDMGVYKGKFWRHATDWFSYNLKDLNNDGNKLRVTYFGGDRNRKFTILINDIELAEVELKGDKGDTFYDVDYQLTNAIKAAANNGILTVKFKAGANSIAGGIYYVRLMK